MCVNTQSINKITTRYQFRILHLDDFLNKISSAIVFTHLDLKSVYHQILMIHEDEWKMMFKICEGLYQWMLMIFGLSNYPSTFMWVMNHLLQSFIGKFMVGYFDDILIYSGSHDMHLTHVQDVLAILRSQHCYAHKKKCDFLHTQGIIPQLCCLRKGILVDEMKLLAVK